MSMSTPPPAEWYPPQQRPLQPQPPAQPARFTIHYGFALLATFSLLGTVVPSIFWFVVAGNAASDTGSDPNAAAGAAGIAGSFGIIWLLWGGMWTLIWAAFAINHTLKERRRS
jgi:hypothetical protein